MLIVSALLPRAVADEWISEEYHCALTIPTQESWTAGTRQPLPNGEMIFHAASMSTNRGLMITFVPEMPSGDLNHPALIKRIADLLELQGWSGSSPTRMEWKGQTFLQFIAQRRDVVNGRQLGIMRAALRGKNLYVITAYGKGEADRAEDPEFMRVMESFRFVDHPNFMVDQSVGPSRQTYRLAMLGTASAVAFLLIGLGVTFLLWRRHDREAA